MAQPTPYTRQYDLSDEQSDNSLQPISGAHLDTEFDAVKVTLDEALANLELIQRDDGALANGIVTVASLSTDVKAIMATGGRVRGSWETDTDYEIGDIAEESSAAYFCLVDHTSGTFATDLAALKWQILTGTTVLDGAVTTAKLDDGAVTAAKVASDAVTTVKIADANVTGIKIAAGAIDATKFATDDVSSAMQTVLAAQTLEAARSAFGSDDAAGFSVKGVAVGGASGAPTNLTQPDLLAGLVSFNTPGHRLSLTTAAPVTTSDVTTTSAATIFFTPYRHNVAPVYNGSKWILNAVAEKSFILDGTNFVANANYDIYLDYNSGTVRLVTSAAWTNATTRAAAISRDATYGWYVNTGSITVRLSNNGGTATLAAGAGLYLGTFRCAANGQSEDSFAKRFLWNMYNRVPRVMKVLEATNSWNYSTASYQQANASTANQIAFVRGLDEDEMSVEVLAIASTSGASTRSAAVGIGIDSVSAISGAAGITGLVGAGVFFTVAARYRGFPGLGYHYAAWLEFGAGADTQTWYGDNGGSAIQSGILGGVMA